LPDEAYVPKSSDIGVQSKTNKQGREEGLSAADSAHVKDLISHQSAEAFSAYGELLSKGVAREQARLVLPVNTYTEFYWKANLLNTMRLLQLRMDPHAQKECQVYAEAIYEMAKEIAPITMEAFSDYWLEGAKFSAQEWTLLKKTLSYSQIEAVLSGATSVLSTTEIAELRKKLT
jgi:thymidylate synthase (FAD)